MQGYHCSDHCSEDTASGGTTADECRRCRAAYTRYQSRRSVYTLLSLSCLPCHGPCLLSHPLYPAHKVCYTGLPAPSTRAVIQHTQTATCPSPACPVSCPVSLLPSSSMAALYWPGPHHTIYTLHLHNKDLGRDPAAPRLAAKYGS